MGVSRGQGSNMFKILTLVAAASAYPQHFYNSYMMAPYPLQYAPSQVYPAPVVQARSDEFDLIDDAKQARYLINFEVFQRVTASFVTMTTPALTVTGKASFYQNPFTGQNSKYKISLNGLSTGDDYYIGLMDTTDNCQNVATGGAETELKTGKAPGIILFDTVKVYGTTDAFNIDGAGTKTKLTDKHIVIRKGTDNTGTLIGCSSAKLA